MNKGIHHQSELQRASQQLICDYMSFLIDQEALVERVVERKLAECLPQMEERLINHIINQYYSKGKDQYDDNI
jgi:hypothetical protein